MQLFYSPLSPFVRKVLVLAHELGLAEGIELIPVNAWQPPEPLVRANPLGKVPTLLLANGESLFDSPVICEYLDGLHGATPRIPHLGPERLAALRLEALADGIAEAAVLRRMEVIRPDGERSASWLALQAEAMGHGLAALEREVASWGERFDLAQIAVACALGYVDFRFAADGWRDRCPQLAAWFTAVSRRPSLLATVPPAA